jgi:uncharacterized protein (UPF0333 family)
MIVKYLRPKQVFSYKDEPLKTMLVSDNGFNLGQCSSLSNFYNIEGELIFNYTGRLINLYPPIYAKSDYWTSCKVIILVNDARKHTVTRDFFVQAL